MYIKNRPGQSQAIRLDQSSDTDAVTDLHFRHDLLSPGQGLAGIQKLSPRLTAGANSFRAHSVEPWLLAPFTSFNDCLVDSAV
jgi:hypothetical protein